MDLLERTFTMRTEPGPGGVVRSIARVDDWFHGFEVTLDVVDGDVVTAAASAHKQPWTTCHGALPSVGRLDGPVGSLRRRIQAAPRDTTCVHVNDLVGLAAAMHRDRTYVVEVDASRARVERDGDTVHDVALDGWVPADGPYAGLWCSDRRWSTIVDEAGGGGDEHEAVLMLRRGILVAIGLFELDWEQIGAGHRIEYDVMTGSCYSFTEPRLSAAVSLVQVPGGTRPRF